MLADLFERIDESSFFLLLDGNFPAIFLALTW